MDPWTHGPMDPWTHGLMDLWTYGPMDLLNRAHVVEIPKRAQIHRRHFRPGRRRAHATRIAPRGADDDPRVADLHAEPFIAERGLADDAVHFHQMAVVLLDQRHHVFRARDAESVPRDVRAV